MRDERYTTVPFGAPTASLPFFNFYIGVKNNMSFSFINRVNNMIPAIHSSFLEIFTRETVLLRRCRCYRSAVAWRSQLDSSDKASLAQQSETTSARSAMLEEPTLGLTLDQTRIFMFLFA